MVLTSRCPIFGEIHLIQEMVGCPGDGDIRLFYAND